MKTVNIEFSTQFLLFFVATAVAAAAVIVGCVDSFFGSFIQYAHHEYTISTID